MSATAPKANGRTRGPRVPLAAATTPEPAPVAALGTATPDLDAAVLAVQAKAGKLIRNATGQVQSRTYAYVTLDAVIDEVLPLLVEHQLLWRTFPTLDEDGTPALRYRMTHIPSGESDEDTMPLLGARDMQTLGSAITYARRYGLTAYLQLTVDPDDDGGAASQPPPGAHAPAAQGPAQPTAAPAKRSERPATAPQRKMLRAKAAAAKLDAGTFANVLKASWGDPPVAWPEQAGAERFLDRALDRLPARLVDDVIAAIASAS